MPTQNIATISSNRAHAIEQAAKLAAEKMAGDDDLNKQIDANVTAREDVQRGPFIIHTMLLDIFDADELNAMPEPGSFAATANDNGNFDRYKWKDTTGATRNGSYYAELTRLLPRGITIHTELEKIRVRKDVKNEFSPDKMTDADVSARKKRLQRQLTTVQGNVRLAMGLWFGMAKGNAVTGVVVDYAKKPKRDDKGKVVKKDDQIVYEYDFDATDPIKVQDKDRPEFAQYFSVTNFLRLDADVANDKGGGYDNYIASNAREQSEEEGSAGYPIESTDNLGSAMLSVLNYLDKKKSDTKSLDFLYKMLRKEGGETILRTFFDLEEVLSMVTHKAEFKAKYEAIVVGDEPEAAKAA